MPAGIASRSCTAVAAAEPELVYDRVTVTLPTLGDGPDACDMALVTVIAEFATVVVSVLVRVVTCVSDTDTMIVPCWPLVAVPGTTPLATKRNTPPAARLIGAVIGVPLS